MRYLKLLCVAMGLSVVAIVVLVVLSPSVEPLDSAASRDAARRPASWEAVDAAESSDNRPELVFPVQAEEMTVEEAEAELTDLAEDLLELYPRDARALLVAGMAYSDMGQSARAEELLRRCVDLSPAQPLAYVGLAENLMLVGRNEEAADVLQSAVAQGKTSPRLIRTLAQVLANLARLEEAIRVLRDGVREFPTDSRNWLRLGQMQILVRRFEEAEASLRKAAKLGEAGSDLLIALNTSLLRQGKHEESAKIRKLHADLASSKQDQADRADDRFQTKYAATFRNNFIIWLTTGALVYLEHGERGRAETLLKRAISLDPEHVKSYRLLASMYERDGRLADLIAVRQRLIDLQPDDVEHYLRLAELAEQTGNDGLAESVLREAVQLDAGGAVAHYPLAILYLSQGRNERARQSAQIAADHLQNVDAYLLLMSTCRAVGDTAAAEEAREKARQLAPNDPRLNRTRF